MLEAQYTYKYIAQATVDGSPSAYGTDAYGSQAYSCSNADTVCLSGGPGAPNTGFLANSNPVLIGGIFVTAALVITVIAYAILRKVHRTKVQK